jgi:hypothetical protein
LPADDVASGLLDASDDLVPGYDRQPASGQVTFDELQVGPADRARRDRQDELVRCGLDVRELHEPQGRRPSRRRLRDLQGAHGCNLPHPKGVDPPAT